MSRHFAGFDDFAASGTVASTVWTGGANLAMYVPFKLSTPFPVRRIFLVNGSAVNGNIDLGVYSMFGSRVFSTGSVAQAGSSLPQFVSVDRLLRPGSYYMAMAISSATARVEAVTTTAARARMIGMLEEVVFPLPAVMTPASFATLLQYPLMGLTQTASGF